MITTLEYTRRYSMFAPDFTYAVTDAFAGWCGEVARVEGSRRWFASNKTWTGGGDLVDTFASRHEAAVALRFIADGRVPADFYGGYATAA